MIRKAALQARTAALIDATVAVIQIAHLCERASLLYISVLLLCSALISTGEVLAVWHLTQVTNVVFFFFLLFSPLMAIADKQ